MATYSTGIGVTWAGTPFTEVQECSWTYGSARQGRDTEWTANQGSVTVVCLGSANTNISNYGLRDQLVVTAAGGAGLTAYATWESVAVAFERNGVTKFTVTFKMLG